MILNHSITICIYGMLGTIKTCKLFIKIRTYLTDGTFIHINFTEAAVNSVKVIDQAVKVLRSNI